jgi:hypothetical protein
MLRKTNVCPTARQKLASFANSLTLSNPANDWGRHQIPLQKYEHQREHDRIPFLRSGNTRFDGMFEVPTFEGGPEPPKRPYAPPARAWGITTAQFRPLLSPRTWPTSRADITHRRSP